jgi:hypothetical protein
MPVSILEDSSKLNPAGRVICILLFFGGVSAMIIAMSFIGKGVEFLRYHSAKERVTTITSSIPEEMSFVLPPLNPPKTRDERILRTRQTEAILNNLTEDAKKDPRFVKTPSNFSDPTKILALGVLSGAVHPKEAQRITSEASTLKITMDENGKWETKIKDVD